MWNLDELGKKIFLLGLILSSLSACSRFQRENQTPANEGYVSFNKDTVLKDISLGQIDIFPELKTTPQPIGYNDALPVNWRQSDYYRIALAAFQSIWGESPDGWSVNEMGFKLDCKYIERGVQKGRFVFFKVDKDANPSIRFERGIMVKPLSEEILWISREFSPSLYNNSIDLARLKYPVETVLQMAENAGGREARLSVDNNCEIYSDLVPGSQYEGWQVGYTTLLPYPNQRPLFLVIDPYTGKLKIINSK
jgi:hypothetical protein